MPPHPRDNEVRTLAAARKLFFERGFSATSSALVAREAGTSKATIYTRWGSMERLLEAVVAAEVNRFGRGTDATVSDFASFRTALVGFGARLLAFLSEPETIRFSRIMHEEARRTPEATKLYFDAAYDGTAERIAALIEQGAPFATCRAPLSEIGERYMAALKGHRYEMAVLGLVETPYPEPDRTSAVCFDGWFVPRAG